MINCCSVQQRADRAIALALLRSVLQASKAGQGVSAQRALGQSSRLDIMWPSVQVTWAWYRKKERPTIGAFPVRHHRHGSLAPARIR